MFFRTLSLLTLITASASAQQQFVEGRIIDASSGKGIKAKVTYATLPTGSLSGTMKDSLYSFTVFGTARYEVTADAAGYNPRTIVVDPAKQKDDEVVFADIMLVPKAEAIVLQHLIFAQGKADIMKESYPQLDDIATMLTQQTSMEIQLEGHAENAGTPNANLELSQQRVDAVRTYLVSKGVSKKRIKTKAFGGSQPLNTQSTEEARAANRRVEMRILKN
jgi:OOP family OmpA-OmpF porin